MSTKLAVAAATLVAVLAGPAFAGDHDLATLLRDSGRYVPDASLPEWTARNPMANAYASARTTHVMPRATVSARARRSPFNAFASALAPTAASPLTPANDFQLQGR